MTSWSLAFLIIAILAALLGFAGDTGMAASLGRILFVIFLLLFAAVLLCNRKSPRNNNSTKGKL